MLVEKIIKSFDFEDGIGAFQPVSTWGSGISITAQSTAHSGNVALRCYASSGIGYARASLGEVPELDEYRLEYWCNSSNRGYGYTDVGITVVDGLGRLIARIGSNDYDLRDTNGSTFVPTRPVGVWMRHIIEWSRITGSITHIVEDVNGVTLGLRTITRSDTIGKVPAEIRCCVRGYTVSHAVLYDDIKLYHYVEHEERKTVGGRGILSTGMIVV